MVKIILKKQGILSLKKMQNFKLHFLPYLLDTLTSAKVWEIRLSIIEFALIYYFMSTFHVKHLNNNNKAPGRITGIEADQLARKVSQLPSVCLQP